MGCSKVDWAQIFHHQSIHPIQEPGAFRGKKFYRERKILLLSQFLNPKFANQFAILNREIDLRQPTQNHSRAVVHDIVDEKQGEIPALRIPHVEGGG